MSDAVPDARAGVRGDGGDEVAPARVVLFGRTGCHLCDDARLVVAAVCEELGERWVEVDVDAGPDADALRARYGDYVPVVTVDGVQQGFWRVDGARLRRALEAGR